MSEGRDRNDGDRPDDGESLVPRGRKRRALRVPVDDVPRQSFVDGGARPPSREMSVPGADATHGVAAPIMSAAPSSPAHVVAPRQRMPSIEVSLDAEIDSEPVAPPPPPPPRSYRPPPPPPSWAEAPTPAAAPIGAAPGAEEPADLAPEPTRVSPPPEPTRPEPADREAPVEIDWSGGAGPEPRSPWEETTKVGKKRSSAPPRDEAPGALPDDPAEAPRIAPPHARPRALDDDDVGFEAVPTAVTHVVEEPRPPRPDPPRPEPMAQAPAPPEAARAPRGLFAGSGSTEVPIPEDDDFQDTVFAPVDEVPRPSRITAAMPNRRGSAAEPVPQDPPSASSDAAGPSLTQSRSIELRREADTGDAARAGAGSSDALALADPSPSVAVASAELRPEPSSVLELDLSLADDAEAPLVPALAAAHGSVSETLVGLGAAEPAPAVVTLAPVVVQRAVNVIGTPSQPPPEPRVAFTTPGVVAAPPEIRDRESDPGLPLELEADGPGDDAEIVEEAISTPAPPKPAPPPQAKPPAPPPAPRPPAPPAAAPAPAVSTEAPAQAPSRPPPKKKHQWWEELFNDDYLRTVPIPHPRSISKQCDFIETRLGLAKGATILDVGCGLGLHAIELTRRGFLVVGLDLSLPMLSRAADEAQDQGFKINFLHADMREMNFEGAFDAVILWGTTLGYFDDDTNRQVIERAYRALKPGGLLLLEVVNRDFAVRSQPNLVWFQGDGCVVMEETSFNFISSRLLVKRNVILDDGRQRESNYSVRLYSLHELGQVLHLRGFRVVEVSGREATPAIYFGADSPKLIILAERRVQPAPAPPAPPRKGDDGPKTGETSLPAPPPPPSDGNGNGAN